MAVIVEIYLSDLDDEADGASVRITNDANSTPADVVAAFKEVYTGMLAAIEEIDAADSAPPAVPDQPPAASTAPTS